MTIISHYQSPCIITKADRNLHKLLTFFFECLLYLRLLKKIRFLSTNAMLKGANGGLKRYLREISSKGGSDETNNKPKEKKMQNKNVVFQWSWIRMSLLKVSHKRFIVKKGCRFGTQRNACKYTSFSKLFLLLPSLLKGGYLKNYTA